jgi:hypothetical protein
MPVTEDWKAVAQAVRSRTSELKMSKAELARQTGLSETTIRYLGQSRNGHYKSALIAISVVLRWRPDHLMNILHGHPEKNVHVKSPGLASLERLLHVGVSALMDDLSAVLETVRTTEKKIDLLLAHERVTTTRTREG